MVAFVVVDSDENAEQNYGPNEAGRSHSRLPNTRHAIGSVNDATDERTENELLYVTRFTQASPSRPHDLKTNFDNAWTYFSEEMSSKCSDRGLYH